MHFPDGITDVLVIGSVNIDTALSVPRMPRSGETIASTAVSERGGGKGANQAVAARVSGASVTLLAAVGTDADMALHDVRDLGVDLTALVSVPQLPTGRAFLLVGDGDNMIVTSEGANAALTADHVLEWSQLHPAPATVVLQHEVAPEVVEIALSLFGGRSVLILNPSPWRDGAADEIARADIVVLNEIELAQVVGRRPSAGESAVSFVESVLTEVEVDVDNIVVTMGSHGAIVRAGSTITHVEAVPVTVVDTVGAGDAFLGALAAAVARGESLVSAARRAVTLAASVVSTPGARALIDSGTRSAHTP